jgi:general secretion pathway protein A
MTIAGIPDPIQTSELLELGLNRPPFTISSDPSMFYLKGAPLVAFQAMQSAIQNQQGAVVIHGEKGSGKTTLAKVVVNMYADLPNLRVCYLPSAKYTSEYAFARDFAKELNMQTAASYAKQKDIIWKEVGEWFGQGISTLFFFDEAQDLDPKALGFLHELWNFHYDKLPITWVAFGQSDGESNTLEIFKQNDSVFDRIFQFLSLGPLDNHHTAAMIRHRHRVAGRDEDLFTNGAISVVYHHSRGNPRRIVRICAAALDMMMILRRDDSTLRVINDDIVETIMPTVIENMPDNDEFGRPGKKKKVERKSKPAKKAKTT